MKRYHGTPQQFEDMIREALGEVTPAEAATDITASYAGWEELAHKSVEDADGFLTDYTLYVNEDTGLYVCVFGDRDLYGPEDGYYDFETESADEAWEWFDDYTILSATNTAGIAAAPKSLNDIDDITTVEIHGSDDEEEIDENELSWI